MHIASPAMITLQEHRKENVKPLQNQNGTVTMTGEGTTNPAHAWAEPGDGRFFFSFGKYYVIKLQSTNYCALFI
jgi:hypothetical protein